MPLGYLCRMAPKFNDVGHNRLYQYWNAARGDRFAPARADFDPVDVPYLLPNLYIYKVLTDPLDYELTLLGTKMVEMMGRDATGQRLDQVISGLEGVAHMRKEYDRVYTTREFVYSEVAAAWVGRDYIMYRRLLLPFSDDGKTVNRILGCAFFTIKEDD